jgi:single-strand DNA-binding protein
MPPANFYPLLLIPMKSVNTVTLLGNATRDPEIKVTPTGSVCTFNLATNRIWKDKAGEKQSLVECHNIVACDSLAEICAQYVRKGKPIYVKGYLKTTAHDGFRLGTIYITQVIAQDVILLGAKTTVSQSDCDEDAA